MTEENKEKRDLSSSLIWTLLVPIQEINDKNAGPIVEWLKERNDVFIWLTSLITGSLVLLTLFGKKPGFNNINEIALSTSLLLMFLSVLCNLICVWQIPKWKLAIRTGLLSNGRRMALDLEITSWVSLVLFLAALVLAAIGNSG